MQLRFRCPCVQGTAPAIAPVRSAELSASDGYRGVPAASVPRGEGRRGGDIHMFTESRGFNGKPCYMKSVYLRGLGMLLTSVRTFVSVCYVASQ